MPPKFFPGVVEQLKRVRPGRRRPENSWRRVIIEKPFGHDLASAKELNAVVDEVFPPKSVFRIDHYLGKETVQNILALRFANEMFEPIWNRNYVDHVQITMAEDIGIGGRAGYYDGIGAARDVIQNHLLQLLALTAMEEPVSFDADAIFAEKVKVLSAVQLPEDLGTHTVRGQYAEGWQGGEKVIGFLEEDGIARTRSPTPTPRSSWRSTPGAGPACRSTCAPASASAAGSPRSRWSSSARRTCRSPPRMTEELGQNALVIRVQPDEGVTVRFGSKVPGTSMEVRDVSMDFQYGEAFTESSPEAYERLILDVLLGDPPLFPRLEEVELGWEILDPIEEFWAKNGKPAQYDAGHLGPGRGRRDAGPRRTHLEKAMIIDLTDTTSARSARPWSQSAAEAGSPTTGAVLTLVISTDERHHYDAMKAAQRGLARAPGAHHRRDAAARSSPHPARRRGAGRRRDRTRAKSSCCGCTASCPRTPTRSCCRCCCRTYRWSPGGRTDSRTCPADPARQARAAPHHRRGRAPQADAELRRPAARLLPRRHRPGLDPAHPVALDAGRGAGPVPAQGDRRRSPARRQPSVARCWRSGCGSGWASRSRGPTDEGPGITGVELMTADGPIALTRPDGELAALSVPGQPDRPVALKRRETAELIAEELRRLDVDDDVRGGAAARHRAATWPADRGGRAQGGEAGRPITMDGRAGRRPAGRAAQGRSEDGEATKRQAWTSDKPRATP